MDEQSSVAEALGTTAEALEEAGITAEALEEAGVVAEALEEVGIASVALENVTLLTIESVAAWIISLIITVASFWIYQKVEFVQKIVLPSNDEAEAVDHYLTTNGSVKVDEQGMARLSLSFGAQ